ncbi:DUF1868 domain-containing protein [Rhodobacterales bacterium LSUCC0387]|nr:DUF1868 domain-containing protein [Rhodobacterales bacterium LSUCC0387]
MTHLSRPNPRIARDEVLARLTGLFGAAAPQSITAPRQGGKFTPDGEVLRHPGNTFLCHVPTDSPLFAGLCAVQDGLIGSPFADSMVFLPRESFHMTVFCGISGAPLGVGGWPAGVRRDAGLEDINEIFRERLSGFRLDGPFRVRACGVNGPNSISMEPDGTAEGFHLRGLRDRLRDLTGLPRDDHETYQFHISLAYMLRFLPAEQADALVSLSEDLFARHLAQVEPITFTSVEFCRFETMFRFDPICLIRSP